MKPFHVIIILIALTVGAVASAQTEAWEARVKADPQNEAVLLEAGIACHGLAVGGNEKAGDLAETYLGRILEQNPRQTLAMAYYGSLMSVFARDAAEPWQKMEYMQTAMARMDKAVMLDPENVQVRLIRGGNSVNLPAMFNRLDLAIEDLAKIESLMAEGKANLDPEATVTWACYYGMALSKKGQNDKARPYLERVVTMASESPLGRQAQATLDKMDGSHE